MTFFSNKYKIRNLYYFWREREFGGDKGRRQPVSGETLDARGECSRIWVPKCRSNWGERESLEETKEEDEKKKKYVTSETLPASVANQADKNLEPFVRTMIEQERDNKKGLSL